MQPMDVAVVTDSTASLSPRDAERERITVVPLQVILGEEVFTEGVDVTADDIARALGDHVGVSTSRPAPEDFGAVYRRLADEGAGAIVSVHLSARISGTYDSALLAAKEAPVEVLVVDAGQVGIGTGFAAGEAARARDAGATAERVAAAARRAGETTTTLLYVDTLEYLRRGGRVGAAAALLGSALAVKPLLTLVDGAVEPLERVRTSGRALARLRDLATDAARRAGDCAIGVQHLAGEEAAERVAAGLADQLGIASVPVDEVGAVIGAHVGPGMVGVSVTPRLTH